MTVSRRQTVLPCESRCGAPCTSRWTRRPTCSRTSSVFDSPLPVPTGGRDRIWTPKGRGFRAAIVARARFIEDLVVEQADSGVAQYVLLGAGLDTFVQRRADLAERIRVFEIDQPGPQAWKRQRLIELGYGIPRVAAVRSG